MSQEFAAALEYSSALARFVRRNPDATDVLQHDTHWAKSKSARTFLDEARAVCKSRGVAIGLRWYRNKEYVRILARDLGGTPFQEIAAEISDLAAAAVQIALDHELATLIEKHGRPRTTEGQDSSFCVLGMGKLGGRELNYASDIDLLYLYRTDEGMTDGGVTLHTFYTKLARGLSRLWAEPTEHGMVYRVDLDLRPEGQNGPTVNSVASARTYYQSWGQTWERFVLLRAAPIAGDIALGDAFLEELHSFIFRKTLDYSTLESIREMKTRIDRKAARVSALGPGYDLKLGSGGIRELEFVVQTLTLLHAGRNPSVRQRTTASALMALAEAGLIPSDDATELQSAYAFLRTLEHRVQSIEMAQTHRLPAEAVELNRIQDSIHANLDARLSQSRAIVTRYFSELFAEPEGDDEEPPAAVLFHDERLDEDDELELVKKLPFDDHRAAIQTFRRIRTPVRGRSSVKGRRYLRRMAGAVLRELQQAADPDAALRNLETFLSRIGAWTTLLALLAENPGTTRTLVRLFGASDHLSSMFIAHPELLDQLVRIGAGTPVRGKKELRDELLAEESAATNLEDRMDVIRRWRRAELLRVALADLSGLIDLHTLSLQLSRTASLCVQSALRAATHEVFGVSDCDGFLVVALGGLGAREVLFGSDLDLVFFYDPARLPEGARSASELAAGSASA